MKRYHVIKSVLGGSDVYDENGNQVGYSLPSVLGGGEDFYDMQGNPVGQTFDDEYGMADFLGVGNNTYGVMDNEILMGRNAWLNGDPFEQTDAPDGFGAGDDFGSDPGWDE
ncbi:MAG: hypothetical protein K6F61_06415 [Clostridiales bacterium]|nr:hypothetical protein [Clostridiales bacterium]